MSSLPINFRNGKYATIVILSLLFFKKCIDNNTIAVYLQLKKILRNKSQWFCLTYSCKIILEIIVISYKKNVIGLSKLYHYRVVTSQV